MATKTKEKDLPAITDEVRLAVKRVAVDPKAKSRGEEEGFFFYKRVRKIGTEEAGRQGLGIEDLSFRDLMLMLSVAIDKMVEKAQVSREVIILQLLGADSYSIQKAINEVDQENRIKSKK